MKIKIGETVTQSISVDLQYRCSSCGKENVVATSLSDSAYTPTVMGVNVRRNLQKRTAESLNEKLERVLDANDPKRFRSANFTCRCKYCGYKEPWAKMNTERYGNIAGCFAGVALFLGFVLYFIGLYPFDGTRILLSFLIVLGIIGSVTTIILKANNCDRMEKRISKLPPESLPTVLPHETALARSLQLDTTTNTKETIQYDIWECKHCGTTNKLQYAQCKKCGQYKGS